MRTLAYFLEFASGMFSQQPSKYVTQGGHHINIDETRLSILLRATTCVGPLDLKERCKQYFAHKRVFTTKLVVGGDFTTQSVEH